MLAAGCCPCDPPEWGDVIPSEESTNTPEEVDPYAAEREADLAARRRYAPDWAAPREAGSGFHVPQIAAPYALFETLQPSQAESVEGGLLLCHVVVTGTGWDTFAGPDLLTEVTIGRSGRLDAWGGEDTYSQTLSAPQVRIARGDLVKMAVWDRDVTTTERIGHAEALYEGNLPFTLHEEDFDGTCFVVGSEVVEERLPARIQTAEEKLEAFGAALNPVPESPYWGYPLSEVSDAQAAVIDVAGHVGWADPRTRALMKRYDTAQKRWNRLVKESIAKTREGLPRRGKKVKLDDGEWTVRVAEVSCSASAKGRWTDQQPSDVETNPCFVTLEVERIGEALEVSTWPMFGADGTIFAVAPDGRNVRMETLMVERGEERYPHSAKLLAAPGDRFKVVMELESSELELLRGKRATHVMKVQLTTGGTSAILRLDKP